MNTKHILQAIQKSFNNPIFSDLILIAQGKQFYVSKLFLAASSPVFEAMLCGNMQESSQSSITIADVSSSDFEHFLRFLYLGETSIDMSNAIALLDLAKKYAISSLAAEIESFLVTNIFPNTVCSIFEQAQHFKLKLVQEACVKFFSKNFKDIVELDDFKHLSKQTLLFFISNSTIPVIQMFTACAKWCRHNVKQKNQQNSENIKENLDQAVQDYFMTNFASAIKFDQIPSDALLLDVLSSNLVSKDFVLSILLKQAQVRRGLIPSNNSAKGNNAEGFLPNYTGSKVSLSADKKTATFTGNGWEGATLAGKASHWKVTLVQNCEYLMLGVAPVHNFRKEGNNYMKCGYYLFCNSGTLFSQTGKANEPYVNKPCYAPGTVIEVIFNDEQLSYRVNEEAFGVAFKNLPRNCLPAFDFHGHNCTVSIEILF